MRVAAIQMVSGEELDTNLIELRKLVCSAVEQRPDVIVLPENFALFSADCLSSLAEKERKDGFVLKQLISLATEFQVSIIANIPIMQRPDGSVCPKGRVRSAMLFINSTGDLIGRYDKAHLFDVQIDDAQGQYQESMYIEPGEALAVIEYCGVKFGLSICYDLRFPYLYQALAHHGAHVMCVSSAFTKVTGEAHWRVLLQARAIENQCYVIGANQGGQHDSKRHTYGHSMIVDPWGKVIDEMEEGAGFVSAELDMDYLKQIRAQIPVYKHQRPELMNKF